jgi:hypothetical protein
MQDIKNPVLSVGSEVYTADGKLIGQYYKENRSPVEFEKDFAQPGKRPYSNRRCTFYTAMAALIFIRFLPVWYQLQKASAAAAVPLPSSWQKPFRNP